VSGPIAADVLLDLEDLAHRLRRVTVEVTGGDRGLGSGVLWPHGFVVTNAHVVRGARASVRLADGRCLSGELVARALDVDLALLRVPGTGIAAAAIAGAEGARVGSLVVAVGNPLGVRGALSAGIVHAIGPITRGGRPWIQADVRLAPGNSGGPLADAAGRVVGVNAMMVGSLALAVPISEVTRFVREAGVQRV
jgi:serine protease Do